MAWKRIVLLVAALAMSACTRQEQAPTPSPAGTAGRVQGSVTAADSGDPLPQVSLSFYSDSGEISGQSVFTDQRGNYSTELPAGKYRVLANSPTEAKPLGWNGYAPVWTNGRLTDSDEERLAVKGDSPTKYDVTLPKVWPSRGRVTTPAPLTASGHVTVIKFRDGSTFASVPLPQDGTYTFPVPDGEWQLQVDVPGYSQAVSAKFVVAGASVSLPEVTLTPA